MLRKSISLVLLCVLIFGLAAAAEEPAPVSKKAGYALIDLYINAIKNMALMGAKDSLDANLNKMMAEAKKARTAGDIDAVFLSRYNRLVAVTKLVTLKDPEKTIAPILHAELGRFVMDVLGEELKTEGPPEAIVQTANALAFAIVDLQIYLDTLDSRQQRYDKFVKSLNPEK
ncbi:MAG: hypothetical protein NTW38_04810 [Candidatus Aminicenantes bacterium]|nr:hypothetical protein [Candidatus Aminicenantes bacterium]